MRIGWYSNAPHIPSGYGQQTAQVLQRLKADGHEVASFSNFGAQTYLEWNGIPVFPDGLKPFSLDIFPQSLRGWGGISVGLFDAWPLVPAAEALKGLNLAWWVPVDHDVATPGVIEFLAKTGCYVIAMSQHGEKVLLEAGVPRELLTYIPHAVDTKTLFTDRGRVAREMMNIPADAHLTMINAANRGRNPIRKAFPENLEALVRHLKNHDDAYAYIHTEPLGLSDGMNLPRFLEKLGAPEGRIRWADQVAFRNGIPNEHLALVYSAADVLLATSMGEGFGVPTIEAQACGTPVIASDWAASSELVGPYGHKIGGQRSWDEFQGAFWITPNISQIASALEKNYLDTKAGLTDRAAVRRFGQRYDADDIFASHWKPLIEKMEKRVAAPVENRAARRAKKSR